MTDTQSSPPELKGMVIHICLACGTVNPSGPAGGCSHVQLARFDGISNELEQLLAQMAQARRQFGKQLEHLKRNLKDALRRGEAEVQAAGNTRPATAPPTAKPQSGPGLTLTNPVKRPSPTAPIGSAGRKRRGAPPVDPRQLGLLAQAPPKGHA